MTDPPNSRNPEPNLWCRQLSLHVCMRQPGKHHLRPPMIEMLENRRLLSADLIGAFAGHLPKQLPVIGTSQIAVRLTNDGAAKAVEPVTVQLFASPTPTPNPTDLLLATNQQNLRLNPRASVNSRLTVTTPTTLPGGSYFLLAEVNGSVVTAAPVQIQAPFSDLAVEFAGLPSRPVEIDGQSAGKRVATVNVVNDGNVPVHGKVNVSFYLSTDNTLDSSDPLLATVSNVAVSLKPGAKKAVGFHIAVPPGTAIGGYFVIARLTPATAATNVSSANNIAVSSSRLAVVNQLPHPAQINKTVNVYLSSSGGGGGACVDDSGDCSDDGGTVVAVSDGDDGGDSNDSSSGADDSSSDNSSSDSSSDDSSDNWDSGDDSSGGDF